MYDPLKESDANEKINTKRMRFDERYGKIQPLYFKIYNGCIAIYVVCCNESFVDFAAYPERIRKYS